MPETKIQTLEKKLAQARVPVATALDHLMFMGGSDLLSQLMNVEDVADSEAIDETRVSHYGASRTLSEIRKDKEEEQRRLLAGASSVRTEGSSAPDGQLQQLVNALSNLVPDPVHGDESSLSKAYNQDMEPLREALEETQALQEETAQSVSGLLGITDDMSDKLAQTTTELARLQDEFARAQGLHQEAIRRLTDMVQECIRQVGSIKGDDLKSRNKA